MLAAQHLDPCRLVGNQRAEVIFALIGIGHFDPVDQHEHVIALRSADPDLRRPPDRAGPADRQSGDVAQHVGHDPGLPLVERGGVEHRHRRSELIGGNRVPRSRCGDHQLGGARCRLARRRSNRIGLGRGRRCKGRGGRERRKRNENSGHETIPPASRATGRGLPSDATDSRRNAWGVRRTAPATRADAAPAAWFVAQTEYRAAVIPWTMARATERRQVSWLAGRRPVRDLPEPCAYAQA
ncbi:hypothetical protein SPHINGOT1_10363 [Sphingomonas sp. T1]|nr:hypothetical protein SPHINGOT1_10363 [Sphingomonas sp. T1]